MKSAAKHRSDTKQTTKPSAIVISSDSSSETESSPRTVQPSQGSASTLSQSRTSASQPSLSQQSARPVASASKWISTRRTKPPTLSESTLRRSQAVASKPSDRVAARPGSASDAGSAQPAQPASSSRLRSHAPAGRLLSSSSKRSLAQSAEDIDDDSESDTDFGSSQGIPSSLPRREREQTNTAAKATALPLPTPASEATLASRRGAAASISAFAEASTSRDSASRARRPSGSVSSSPSSTGSPPSSAPQPHVSSSSFSSSQTTRTIQQRPSSSRSTRASHRTQVGWGRSLWDAKGVPHDDILVDDDDDSSGYHRAGDQDGDGVRASQFNSQTSSNGGETARGEAPLDGSQKSDRGSQRPASPGRMSSSRSTKQPIDRPSSPPKRFPVEIPNAGRVPDNQLWIDKYRPGYQGAELAVHKKKVEQVKQWLQLAFQSGSKKGSLLLLTGPSGSGKTATLQSLAAELSYEISEWTNPINTNSLQVMYTDDKRNSDSSDFADWTSISTKFNEFLERSSRLSALQLTFDGTDPAHESTLPKSSRRVILIEDLPNVTELHTRQSFHAAIRKYIESRFSICPLVLVISDVSEETGGRLEGSLESVISIRNLVPPDVLSSPQCTEIKFNPVAPTIMTKALNRILDFEFPVAAPFLVRKRSRAGASKLQAPPVDPKRPNRDWVDRIVKSSDGDLRNAINSLQFLALNELAQASPPELSGRDMSLSLYHSLGRILHNKRETDAPTDGDSTSLLPEHLSHHSRPRLKFDPEPTFEMAHMDFDKYALFLHGNYPDYLEDIDEVLMASQYFSDADLFMNNWKNRAQLAPYSASVGIRGLLFSKNSALTSSQSDSGSLRGFEPFRKPEFWQTQKRRRELEHDGLKSLLPEWIKQGIDAHRDDRSSQDMTLFRAYNSTELFSDIFPFTCLINRFQHGRRFHEAGPGPGRQRMTLGPRHVEYLQQLTFFPTRDRLSAVPQRTFRDHDRLPMDEIEDDPAESAALRPGLTPATLKREDSIVEGDGDSDVVWPSIDRAMNTNNGHAEDIEEF
ncbi:Rad17 cell cycle checkpoint protein-domain-containing protein [Polychytrium aggregatum]|uniref:Rad17 cell cycle checkpoint protein-domain-containing protein n=1 Tax=Polychytrium aggregatum TaxID=110093 RepID=UPI0022FDE978|nr:Rad17 cell cycle checkpoint protein-domain-containing protein [Polychytrium aggregatum]KAI9202543.1 Rad17 cell cycle checkpoint protein-domain-containing protein [Polychytrium aggregatum]